MLCLPMVFTGVARYYSPLSGRRGRPLVRSWAEGRCFCLADEEMETSL